MIESSLLKENGNKNFLPKIVKSRKFFFYDHDFFIKIICIGFSGNVGRVSVFW